MPNWQIGMCSHWFCIFFSNPRGAGGHMVVCHSVLFAGGVRKGMYQHWININFKALHAHRNSPMVTEPLFFGCECRSSGTKAVVAMDSFRAWKAPVAPGDNGDHLPLKCGPRIWCWWMLVVKKPWDMRDIYEISAASATFSFAYGSTWLVTASAGHLSKLPWTQCQGNALHMRRSYH